MKIKRCSKCKEEKLIEYFSKNKATKDGYCCSCKICDKIYRDSNKERIALTHKNWREDNKEDLVEKKKTYYNNNKERPGKILDELIKRTTEKYNIIKEEQNISKNKKEEFVEQTKVIVLNAINYYSIIKNQSAIDENTKSFTIHGIYQLMDKAGFADNQEISYLNSDSVVAQSVAAKYSFYIF